MFDPEGYMVYFRFGTNPGKWETLREAPPQATERSLLYAMT